MNKYDEHGQTIDHDIRFCLSKDHQWECYHTHCFIDHLWNVEKS